MEELFKSIEEKIRSAGYHGPADGEEIYNEICDEIEAKEPGTYLFMSKKEGNTFFEYKIDVLEDQFNLSWLDIHTDSQIFHVDFDA